jgi:UMF1 family MFS transporter
MKMENLEQDSVPAQGADEATSKEIFSWAMFDFANSSYSTVVITTVFNTYFVNVIAKEVVTSAQAGSTSDGLPTLLWTVAVGISNFFIVLTAPVLGAFADYSAAKKTLLVITTAACACCTALLALTHAGTVALAMFLIVLANCAYGTGENLIAAFLTEIAPREKMGRISAIGLALGYFGGPLVLAICLVYIHFAQQYHLTETVFVPHVMLLVAVIYSLCTLPTFFWLKERAVGVALPSGRSFVQIGFQRLVNTLKQARRYKDLFAFLVALLVFSCGTATVIVIAAIYAQKVIGFSSQDTIAMILFVNVTAALGAFAFGQVQDKIGSVKTLLISLTIWVAATSIAFFITTKLQFWLDAILIGVAMGSTQSTARALIGQFSPAGRSAEFYGLWGLTVRLASIIGPVTFGMISYLTNGNERLAILSTATFFILGLVLMLLVDEKRGIAAALADDPLITIE